MNYRLLSTAQIKNWRKKSENKGLKMIFQVGSKWDESFYDHKFIICLNTFRIISIFFKSDHSCSFEEFWKILKVSNRYLKNIKYSVDFELTFVLQYPFKNFELFTVAIFIVAAVIII